MPMSLNTSPSTSTCTIGSPPLVKTESSTTVFPPTTSLEPPPGWVGGGLVGGGVPSVGGGVVPSVGGGVTPSVGDVVVGDSAGGIENGSRPANTGIGLTPVVGDTLGSPPPPGPTLIGGNDGIASSPSPPVSRFIT